MTISATRWATAATLGSTAGRREEAAGRARGVRGLRIPLRGRAWGTGVQRNDGHPDTIAPLCPLCEALQNQGPIPLCSGGKHRKGCLVLCVGSALGFSLFSSVLGALCALGARPQPQRRAFRHLTGLWGCHCGNRTVPACSQGRASPLRGEGTPRDPKCRSLTAESRGASLPRLLGALRMLIGEPAHKTRPLAAREC